MEMEKKPELTEQEKIDQQKKRDEEYQKREEDRRIEHEQGRKELVKQIGTVFCFLLLFASLSLLFSIKIGGLLFVGIAVYALTSLRIVSSNEIAAIRLLGKAVGEAHAGLSFIPPVLCQLAIYSRETQVIEIGSPLEDDDGNAVEASQKREGVIVDNQPLRITMKGNPKAEDELDRPLTVDPRIQLQFVIRDVIVFDQQKRSIPRAANELVDVVKSSLQKLFGNKSPRMVLEEISSGTITMGIQNELEWLIGEPQAEPPVGETEKNRKQYWGIDVRSVGVTTLGLPRTVNIALRDARKGEIEAGKEKIKRTKEGEGDAAARVALLEAEATGLAKKADVAKTKEGQFVLKLEATQQMLKNTEKVIITPSDGLMNSVMSMFQGLKATGKEPSKTQKKKEDQKVTK